nr:(2Fe-2S)-binding protein [Celeribacter indicus]
MFRRLEPILDPIEVMVDGVPCEAEAGESVAAILLRSSSLPTRRSPVGHQPRAPYCMMGACFDCLVTIDGRSSQQSCLVRARHGMRIDRQNGMRSVV